jgi:hypothetical protein
VGAALASMGVKLEIDVGLVLAFATVPFSGTLIAFMAAARGVLSFVAASRAMLAALAAAPAETVKGFDPVSDLGGCVEGERRGDMAFGERGEADLRMV